MSKKRVRKASVKQRLRRREGDVKRLEVVLVADSERDQWVAHWMDEHLGRGEASEFTRIALEEKIARIVGGDDPGDHIEDYLDELFAHHAPLGIDPERLQRTIDSLADAINELRAELQTVRLDLKDALDKIEAQGAEIDMLRAELDQHSPHASTFAENARVQSPPELSGTVQSSGLDLSRPRPRKTLPKTAPIEAAAPDTLTEQDQIRLAKIMANSIKNAQPGKRG